MSIPTTPCQAQFQPQWFAAAAAADGRDAGDAYVCPTGTPSGSLTYLARAINASQMGPAPEAGFRQPNARVLASATCTRCTRFGSSIPSAGRGPPLAS
jgi:hypothetical protein